MNCNTNYLCFRLFIQFIEFFHGSCEMVLYIFGIIVINVLNGNFVYVF